MGSQRDARRVHGRGIRSRDPRGDIAEIRAYSVDTVLATAVHPRHDRHRNRVYARASSGRVRCWRGRLCGARVASRRGLRAIRASVRADDAQYDHETEHSQTTAQTFPRSRLGSHRSLPRCPPHGRLDGNRP